MIIGITGTNGAGKGTVVDYLVEKKGFTHYSGRAAITEEILKRGLEVNRMTLNQVSTDMREKDGADYLTKMYLARAKREGVTNAILESVRHPLEAKMLKEHGAVLLVVDADRRIRYERITKRASATDKISFEEFCAQEDMEMTSKDPANSAAMNISEVIKMADYTIQNNGTVEELHAKIDALPIFS